MLIVFSGLPGTGKTTLSKALAAHLECTYLRIDSIEQALRKSGALRQDVGASGYQVTYAMALDNLRFDRCSWIQPSRRQELRVTMPEG